MENKDLHIVAGKNGCGACVDHFRPNNGQPKAGSEIMQLSILIQPTECSMARNTRCSCMAFVGMKLPPNGSHDIVKL